jgi:D-alanine-D-alanine ligase
MIKVGVLRGGPSNEYEVSLKTGQSVLDNLGERYEIHDILIDRNGHWYLKGLKVDPHKISSKLDVCFNCLHGAYGEDGKVQQILDSVNIPYTGSGVAGSFLAMNKILAKKNFETYGLRTPKHESLRVNDDIESELNDIFRSWHMPVIIKPSNGGSSIGTSLAYSFFDLKEAVAEAFNHSREVIIEEFINGKEATCGVLENFRGEELYALLPVEIVKFKNKPVFDYRNKYNGLTKEIVPGRFSAEEKAEIQRMAREAHRALGLRHYSRSDFIVSPQGIFILETNSLPGLTSESLYPKSLEAIGSNLKEFCKHLIDLALKTRR